METRTNLPPRKHSGHLHQLLASWRRRLALASALAAMALLLTLAPPASAIGPDFELELLADGLSVTGATEGGEVIWFGAWRTPHIYWTELNTLFETTTDSDSDGNLVWSLGEPIPQAAVFFAVDQATGNWSLASPPGFSLEALPAAAIAVAEDGSSVAVDSSSLSLLVVRTGQEAWSHRVIDGGSADSTPGRDRLVTFLSTALSPPATESAQQPPSSLSDGDLLFGIDTKDLRVFVHLVEGGEK